MMVVMDHSGDRTRFLTACSVLTTGIALSTLGVWMHKSLLLPSEQLSVWGMDTGIFVPGVWVIPFNIFVPSALFYMVVMINRPTRWLHTIAGSAIGFFTGNMGSTWVCSMQCPLVIALAASNADSRAWGTRAVEEPDAAQSVDLQTRASILWWKKIFLSVLWFGITFFVSFLQILCPKQIFQGINFQELAWGPYTLISTRVPLEYQYYVQLYVFSTLPAALILEICAQWFLVQYRSSVRKAEQEGYTSWWSYFAPIANLRIMTFPMPTAPILPTYDCSGTRTRAPVKAPSQLSDEEEKLLPKCK